MRTGFPVSPLSKSWKELYKAALFETDKSRVSERIAQAEWALSLRARELFHTMKGNNNKTKNSHKNGQKTK